MCGRVWTCARERARACVCVRACADRVHHLLLQYYTTMLVYYHTTCEDFQAERIRLQTEFITITAPKASAVLLLSSPAEADWRIAEMPSVLADGPLRLDARFEKGLPAEPREEKLPHREECSPVVERARV